MNEPIFIAFLTATVAVMLLLPWITQLIGKFSEPEIFYSIAYQKAELKENKTFYIIIAVFIYLCSYLVFERFGVNLLGFSAMVFALFLIGMSAVDAKTQYLPDIFTKSLIVMGVAQSYYELHTALFDSLIGAFLGYGILWTVNTLFRILRKKEGMGYGDFKLLAAIGAWAGPMQLPLVIFASSFLGILIAVGLKMLKGQELNQPFPFGPCLAATGFISLCYGNELLRIYLEALG